MILLSPVVPAYADAALLIMRVSLLAMSVALIVLGPGAWAL